MLISLSCPSKSQTISSLECLQMFKCTIDHPACGKGPIHGTRHRQEHIKHAYRQVFNIRRTLADNKVVYYSDVVGASSVGAAPTSSSLST